MDEILELLRQDPEKCVQKLEVYLQGKENNLDALQLAAEVHFELGNGELAYEALMRAVELDPKGKVGGTNKFLWLAQLTGGQRGLEYYELGMNTQDKAQVVQALLGMIEIWMTDLCMEEPAEKQCEALIAKALLLTEDESPEVYSILGSIRISQQNEQEAKKALLKSWELYQEQATVDYLPQIIRLAQSMLEMELVDEVLDLTTICTKIDDEVPDFYYLNALAHKMNWQQIQEDRHAAGVRDAVELLLALPLVEPEMVQAAKELIQDVPDVDVPESDDDENDDERVVE